MPDPKSVVRTALKGFILTAIYLVVIVVGLEVLLRVTGTGRLHSVLHLEQNVLTYLPNQKKNFKYIEWDYEIEINADGFRNDLTLDQITNGSIVVLGDSFTEGYGVALQDSYSKVLERSISKWSNSNVYNAGHTDSGISHYTAVYEKIFSIQKKIDRVVIGFFIGNDMVSTTNQLQWELTEKKKPTSFLAKTILFLNENSLIYTTVNVAVKSNPTLRKICQSFGRCIMSVTNDIYDPSEYSKYVAPSIKILAALSQRIVNDGKTPLFLIIPTREQIVDVFWEAVISKSNGKAELSRFGINKALVAGLKEKGLPVLDLTEIFFAKEQEGRESLYFKFDGHWSKLGHRLAGETLASFFSTRRNY